MMKTATEFSLQVLTQTAGLPQLPRTRAACPQAAAGGIVGCVAGGPGTPTALQGAAWQEQRPRTLAVRRPSLPCPQVRKCEKAIRGAHAANAELLSTTKGVMTLPLPLTYEDTNAGAGGTAAVALHQVSRGHWGSGQVGGQAAAARHGCRVSLPSHGGGAVAVLALASGMRIAGVLAKAELPLPACAHVPARRSVAPTLRRKRSAALATSLGTSWRRRCWRH